MSATFLGCPIAELGLDLLLDRNFKAYPSDRPWRMVVRDRLLQSSWLRHHPTVGLPIVAQNGLVQAHPGLLRILTELIGCERPNAIDEIAHANDGPGAAGDQPNLASDGGSSTTNLPSLLA